MNLRLLKTDGTPERSNEATREEIERLRLEASRIRAEIDLARAQAELRALNAGFAQSVWLQIEEPLLQSCIVVGGAGFMLLVLLATVGVLKLFGILKGAA